MKEMIQSELLSNAYIETQIAEPSQERVYGNFQIEVQQTNVKNFNDKASIESKEMQGTLNQDPSVPNLPSPTLNRQAVFSKQPQLAQNMGTSSQVELPNAKLTVTSKGGKLNFNTPDIGSSVQQECEEVI